MTPSTARSPRHDVTRRTFAVGLTPALALLVAGASVPAAAAPYYEAYLYNLNNLAFLTASQGSEPPQAIDVAMSYGNSFTVARAVSVPGDLLSYVDCTGYPPVNVGMECGSQFRIEDLVITDGTGVAKPVTVSIRIDVAGTASYASSSDPANVTGLTGNVWVTAGFAQPDYRSLWSPSGGRIGNSEPSFGAFAGISAQAFSGTFLIGPFSLTTEQNETVTIRSVATSGPYAASGSMQGVCNLATRFAVGSEAIVLPPGFVANSADAGIVDNWFTGQVVGVAATEGRPGGPELSQNAPNPCAGKTEIRYVLPEGGPARLDVFDVAGRRVAELTAGVLGAGPHAVSWSGRDAAGRLLPPGVYYYALETRGERVTRRMVLLR